jgi:Ca2+-binding RTX toxin-like protein
MELMLLLLLPVVLGGVLLAGGDNDDNESEPDPETGPRFGTSGDDLMRGAAEDNNLNGAAGDDLMFGYRGDDTLAGGLGDDLINGGLDDDVLQGGNGEDLLVGGQGNDNLQGGRGEDFLIGGSGDDTLDGGEDDDILVGSTGADSLYGGAGDDVLDGVSPEAGASLKTGVAALVEGFTEDARVVFPTITDADINRFLADFASEEGEHAPDALFGGAGEDALLGDNGDTLSGGADEDRFAVNWTTGNAPVQITDYDTVASEEILIVVSDNLPGPPVLGLRDSFDGSATQILVNGEVAATLTGVMSAQVNLAAITAQTQSGNGLGLQPIRLPAELA